MKARFIKQFKLDTPSGPLTINVGDEWTLTRTTDGSAVIVMGHGIQQKVPEEYFELPDRKVKESKSMKLTKARLKQIIKEELEATGGRGAGQVPMGVDHQLDPRVRRHTKLFWYETADGEQVPIYDDRLNDEAVKEVSGKVIRIIPRGWYPGGERGPFRAGPYVIVQEPAGTIEIGPEWFDSIFIK